MEGSGTKPGLVLLSRGRLPVVFNVQVNLSHYSTLQYVLYCSELLLASAGRLALYSCQPRWLTVRVRVFVVL